MPLKNPEKARNASGFGPFGGISPVVILAAAALIVFILLLIVAASFSGGLEGYASPSIAIIPIKGEISNSDDGALSGTLSANEAIGFIDEADKDPRVGAIFLDIDSPGGEIVASKQLAYKVHDAKKPVYAYINSVGASGGYYIAAASDYVMADEDSITGSIGVISILLNVQELMQKIGVKATVLKEGNLKDMGSPFKEPTADENAVFEKILSQAFNNFKRDVLSFRQGKLSPSMLDEIADGRVLTGRQAFDANLLDGLTTREKALQKSAELAGLKNPGHIQYGRRELSFSDLFFSAGKSFFSGAMSGAGAQANAQVSIR